MVVETLRHRSSPKKHVQKKVHCGKGWIFPTGISYEGQKLETQFLKLIGGFNTLLVKSEIFPK